MGEFVPIQEQDDFAPTSGVQLTLQQQWQEYLRQQEEAEYRQRNRTNDEQKEAPRYVGIILTVAIYLCVGCSCVKFCRAFCCQRKINQGLEKIEVGEHTPDQQV